jgi:hypothetical protein
VTIAGYKILAFATVLVLNLSHAPSLVKRTYYFPSITSVVVLKTNQNESEDVENHGIIIEPAQKLKTSTLEGLGKAKLCPNAQYETKGQLLAFTAKT